MPPSTWRRSGETRRSTARPADTIKAQGFTCSINFPYAGGEINRRQGDPGNGIETVMVEINKKRFMDIDTFRKTAGFDETKAAANAVLAAIGKAVRRRLGEQKPPARLPPTVAKPSIQHGVDPG